MLTSYRKQPAFNHVNGKRELVELKNNIFVVSLTHWDREWRFPFETTRVLLMEMMDSVLEMLDSDADYKCFHLDGQTILLDDYVQARPENKNKIIDWITVLSNYN